MNIFFNFWSFLDLKKKLLFYLIVFFSSVVAFFELLGISAVIPFAAFLLNPDALIEFEIISKFVDLSFLKKNNKDLIYIFGGIFSYFFSQKLDDNIYLKIYILFYI